MLAPLQQPAPTAHAPSTHTKPPRTPHRHLRTTGGDHKDPAWGQHIEAWPQQESIQSQLSCPPPPHTHTRLSTPACGGRGMGPLHLQR